MGSSRVTEIEREKAIEFSPYSVTKTFSRARLPVLLLEQHVLKTLHPKEKKMQMRHKRVLLPAEM